MFTFLQKTGRKVNISILKLSRNVLQKVDRTNLKESTGSKLRPYNVRVDLEDVAQHTESGIANQEPAGTWWLTAALCHH